MNEKRRLYLGKKKIITNKDAIDKFLQEIQISQYSPEQLRELLNKTNLSPEEIYWGKKQIATLETEKGGQPRKIEKIYAPPDIGISFPEGIDVDTTSLLVFFHILIEESIAITIQVILCPDHKFFKIISKAESSLKRIEVREKKQKFIEEFFNDKIMSLKKFICEYLIRLRDKN